MTALSAPIPESIPSPDVPGGQCGTRSYGTGTGPGEFPWTCAIFQRNQTFGPRGIVNGPNQFLGNCAIVPSRFDNNNNNGVKVVTTKDVMALMKSE